MAKKNKSVIKGSQINIGGDYIVGDYTKSESSQPPSPKPDDSQAIMQPSQISVLISEGKIEQALKALMKATINTDKELYQYSLLQMANWSRIKKQELAGLTNQTETNSAVTKITFNAIKLCNDLDELINS